MREHVYFHENDPNVRSDLRVIHARLHECDAVVGRGDITGSGVSKARAERMVVTGEADSCIWCWPEAPDVNDHAAALAREAQRLPIRLATCGDEHTLTIGPVTIAMSADDLARLHEMTEGFDPALAE